MISVGGRRRRRREDWKLEVVTNADGDLELDGSVEPDATVDPSLDLSHVGL